MEVRATTRCHHITGEAALGLQRPSGAPCGEGPGEGRAQGTLEPPGTTPAPSGPNPQPPHPPPSRNACVRVPGGDPSGASRDVGLLCHLLSTGPHGHHSRRTSPDPPGLDPHTGAGTRPFSQRPSGLTVRRRRPARGGGFSETLPESTPPGARGDAGLAARRSCVCRRPQGGPDPPVPMNMTS